MSTLGFLTALQSLGVELWPAGNRLQYRAPEGTVTKALREEMARQKDQILSLLGRKEPGCHAPAGSRHRLSPAQERLWFMSQLVPDNALYNETTVYRLSGRQNTPALRQSLNELVRRHEALRTQFETSQGQPYQRIQGTACLNIGLVDMSGLSKDAREDVAYDLLSQQARAPFDLGK